MQMTSLRWSPSVTPFSYWPNHERKTKPGNDSVMNKSLTQGSLKWKKVLWSWRFVKRCNMSRLLLWPLTSTLMPSLFLVLRNALLFIILHVHMKISQTLVDGLSPRLGNRPKYMNISNTFSNSFENKCCHDSSSFKTVRKGKVQRQFHCVCKHVLSLSYLTEWHKPTPLSYLDSSNQCLFRRLLNVQPTLLRSLGGYYPLKSQSCKFWINY